MGTLGVGNIIFKNLLHFKREAIFKVFNNIIGFQIDSILLTFSEVQKHLINLDRPLTYFIQSQSADP